MRWKIDANGDTTNTKIERTRERERERERGILLYLCVQMAVGAPFIIMAEP